MLYEMAFWKVSIRVQLLGKEGSNLFYTFNFSLRFHDLLNDAVFFLLS